MVSLKVIVAPRLSDNTTKLRQKMKNDIREFTLRAVVAGIIFGVVFGSANAYLGLRVGLTVSTSIPIAVLTVLFLSIMPKRGEVILEANIAQTIGSASSSLATGTIFTIPALFLWGMTPPFMQVALLALLGGFLGIAAMIPLRRLLIVRSADELPYPEGTACAEVLRATTATSSSGGRWIFIGIAVGAVVKLALGAFALMPSTVSMSVPLMAKAELALEIAPALLAVGYILGYRQSAIMVSGSLISAIVLTPVIALVGANLTAPLFPEMKLAIGAMTASQIWSRYVRYIGAGAVAAAGIFAVARALPTMWSSFAAVIKGLRSEQGVNDASTDERDRDLPSWVVLVVPLLVVITLVSVPGLFAGNMAFMPRLVAAIGVAIFGIAFVVVSSRIVGLIGVSSNPTSAMTLVTLLGVSVVFVLLGWRDPSARAAILTVGTVVCIAASKAGDISQDLKTGFLVGATPAKQQFGQFIGAAFACWAVAGTVLLLGKAFTFGSPDLPAPQATLMKTVIEGVLSGSLPWGLVGVGAALTICALIAGLPGLAFAVGIYLPLSSLTPIFVGGVIRRVVDAKREGKTNESDKGVLAASGMIAGEGLAGVAIAFLVGAMHWNMKKETLLAGPTAAIAGVVVVIAVCTMLYRAARA
jgi:putative OPT family oligopeptide transporter